MAINSNCHVIGVIGGKGGVGKSIFAANLAVAFNLEMKVPALIMDLDSLSCGDQNIILGVRDPKTISELSNFSSSITQANLAAAVSVLPSGIHFVGAVKTRGETAKYSAEGLLRQIETLSNFYRFIILDLGNQVGPLQSQAIEVCTVLLAVTLPEAISITQSMKLIDDLLAGGVPGDMIQIVVNKFFPGGLTAQQIEQTIRRRVLALVPQDDVTVSGSLQRSTPFVAANPKAPISSAHFEVVRKLTGGLLQQLKGAAKPQKLTIKTPEATVTKERTSLKGAPSDLDPKTAMKLRILNDLSDDLELKKVIASLENSPDQSEEVRRKAAPVVSKLVDMHASGVGRDERSELIKDILDEAVGLGPLEKLLEDPSVTEIMVNGPYKIFIEKSGLVQLSPMKFASNDSLKKVIDRIVAPLGRSININMPYVDARLQDGSRVNAVIPPLAIDGAAVTIRKFSKNPVTPEMYYQKFGASTQQMIEFLKICVANKQNVIVSGGTGSGKTTLLNTLSGFIPSHERLVTVEDAAELQLKQEHVVRLETRPASMEGKGAVTIRDLVRNALRMRPDRIIVGECRDGAALDMLAAMSTGHDGSMTTVHANSPREAIGRLETLCLMAGMDLPARAIREQIANSVNFIVQIGRLSDGSRKIKAISEVQGLQEDKVTMLDVFEFVPSGYDSNRKVVGKYVARGFVPRFIQDLQKRGIPTPPNLFANDPDPKPNVATPANTPTANTAQIKPMPSTSIDPKKASGGGQR